MNGNKKSLTLLHTSDLHLGDEYNEGASLRDLDRVFEAAQQLDVQALLVAGDVFDTGRVSQEAVGHVFQGLGKLGIPVFLLPGNHDVILTGANGHNFPLPPIPPNVHLFSKHTGETMTSSALGLSVWGRPVYDHTPSFRPLEGLPPRPNGTWFVAIAHGLVLRGLNGANGPVRSSPITLEELERADCDYIALGHVHVFEEIEHNGPPTFYSGASCSIRDKTAALVTLDPEQGVNVKGITIS